MKVSVRVIGNTPTIIVEENDVTCTLKLAKAHDIITTGEDTNGLGKRLARSYRDCFGKGCSGKEYLKLIKKNLIENEEKKNLKGE